MPTPDTYYLTAADAEGLVIRPAATTDEATPNHNAVAAQNLIRLAVLAGDDHWREKADRLIAAIAPQAVENLYMHMALLNAVDLRLARRRDRGDRGGRPRRALLAAARALPPLDRIVLHAASAAALPAAHPARDKLAAASEPQPSSASAKPVRCRSPIRPASLAPSMRCDILDAPLHSATIRAL